MSQKKKIQSNIFCSIIIQEENPTKAPKLQDDILEEIIQRNYRHAIKHITSY